MKDISTTFEKYYLNLENVDGTIKINIYDDGFWENLNTRSTRSLDTIYLPNKQHHPIPIIEVLKLVEGLDMIFIVVLIAQQS